MSKMRCRDLRYVCRLHEDDCPVLLLMQSILAPYCSVDLAAARESPTGELVVLHIRWKWTTRKEVALIRVGTPCLVGCS